MKYLQARNRDLSLLFAPVFGNLSLLFARSGLPGKPFAPICPGLLGFKRRSERLSLLFAPASGIFRSYLPPAFYPVLGPFALICPGVAGLGILAKGDFRSYLPRP